MLILIYLLYNCFYKLFTDDSRLCMKCKVCHHACKTSILFKAMFEFWRTFIWRLKLENVKKKDKITRKYQEIHTHTQYAHYHCVCDRSGSCLKLDVQPVVINMQYIITTPTSTEANHPHHLPVSQFAPSFLGLSNPDTTDWNQVTLLPLPQSH